MMMMIIITWFGIVIFLAFFCFGFEKRFCVTQVAWSNVLSTSNAVYVQRQKKEDKFNKNEFKTEFILKIKKLLK